MTTPKDLPLGPSARIGRRALLKASSGILALGAVHALLPVRVAFAAGPDEQSFLDISGFVTGKTLDPSLSRRYFAALTKRDAGLMDQIGAVQALITSTGARDIDALIAVPGFDDAIRATVTTLVKAWYSGVVGELEDAELIAYADALMYAPTKGILVVPSYGRGPATWGPNPTLAAN